MAMENCPSTKLEADGHGFQGIVPDLVQFGDHALDRRQDQPADLCCWDESQPMASPGEKSSK
jgi:hypothetical protein